MKKIMFVFCGEVSVLMGALVLGSSLVVMPVQADRLGSPTDPMAPTPHAGVEPGHRAAGDFTARRPGNLPKYGPQAHSYTGVSSKTP